jgi:hypothetical protein
MSRGPWRPETREKMARGEIGTRATGSLRPINFSKLRQMQRNSDAWRKRYANGFQPKKIKINRAGRPPLASGASHELAADNMRHELRDGSGALMWPERCKDSLTPYSDGLREIDAAEARRSGGASKQMVNSKEIDITDSVSA